MRGYGEEEGVLEIGNEVGEGKRGRGFGFSLGVRTWRREEEEDLKGVIPQGPRFGSFLLTFCYPISKNYFLP